MTYTNGPVLDWNLENLRWMDQAACKGLPVNMFFYTEEDYGRKERRRKDKAAKAVCAECPVKAQCLQDALDRDDAHSIQGGTTPKDRGHRVYLPEVGMLSTPVTVVIQPARRADRKVTADEKEKVS